MTIELGDATTAANYSYWHLPTFDVHAQTDRASRCAMVALTCGCALLTTAAGVACFSELKRRRSRHRIGSTVFVCLVAVSIGCSIAGGFAYASLVTMADACVDTDAVVVSCAADAPSVLFYTSCVGPSPVAAPLATLQESVAAAVNHTAVLRQYFAAHPMVSPVTFDAIQATVHDMATYR